MLPLRFLDWVNQTRSSISTSLKLVFLVLRYLKTYLKIRLVNHRYNNVKITDDKTPAQRYSICSARWKMLRLVYQLRGMLFIQICVLSLPNFRLFTAFIQSENPDIVLITKSWLHEKIPDSVVSILGYAIFRVNSE